MIPDKTNYVDVSVDKTETRCNTEIINKGGDDSHFSFILRICITIFFNNHHEHKETVLRGGTQRLGISEVPYRERWNRNKKGQERPWTDTCSRRS
jgi:hypothetical protein